MPCTFKGNTFLIVKYQMWISFFFLNSEPIHFFAESDKLINSHLRERENSLYDILHNQNPSVSPGHIDPQENDVIEHPKQSFPPVPGAGYIPPASIIEQSAPQILGFQHERDAPRVECK